MTVDEMSDLQVIARHLKRVGKRAGVSLWVADSGFGARIDVERQGTSPVFFETTAELAMAKVAAFCRDRGTR